MIEAILYPSEFNLSMEDIVVSDQSRKHNIPHWIPTPDV